MAFWPTLELVGLKLTTMTPFNTAISPGHELYHNINTGNDFDHMSSCINPLITVFSLKPRRFVMMQHIGFALVHPYYTLRLYQPNRVGIMYVCITGELLTIYAS